MSDYLWDKTGEPEEDVAQLEQLLGTLRHEPRPFVLPADFSAHTARSSFRPQQRQQQRPFGWQRLALAASLLLTLLAGAWLIMRLQQPEVRHESAQQHNSAPVERAPEQAPQQQATNANGAHEQPAPQLAATPVIERVNYRPARRVFSRVGAKARRHEAQPLATPVQEQVAEMTPEQKAATEQLLLALRIASAKYNYAQREVQELSAARKPETR